VLEVKLIDADVEVILEALAAERTGTAEIINVPGEYEIE
jgi:hypothetical protein